MEFTVNRSSWLRGEANSFLLRPSDNKMCCLGFLAKKYGYSDEEIFNKDTFKSLSNIDKLPEEFFYGSGNLSFIIQKLMFENDKIDISDEDREKKLTEFFKLINIDVKFED